MSPCPEKQSGRKTIDLSRNSYWDILWLSWNSQHPIEGRISTHVVWIDTDFWRRTCTIHLNLCFGCLMHLYGLWHMSHHLPTLPVINPSWWWSSMTGAIATAHCTKWLICHSVMNKIYTIYTFRSWCINRLTFLWPGNISN